MIISRTPFRISLFGGGTDYPEWFNKNSGSVISMSIDKYCYISIRNLPNFFEHKYRFVWSKIELINSIEETKHPAIKATLRYVKWQNRGLEIHHNGDLPARSGLGSSSAFVVGLLNSLYELNRIKNTKFKLSSDAIHIEQKILKENVGCQDQIAVSYGGLNRINFKKKNKFEVGKVLLSKKKSFDLESSLLLVFTGITRISSRIAKKKIENIKSKKNNFYQILNLVDEAEKIIKSKNTSILELGKILHESWLIKKDISSSISNSRIDDIYELSLQNGALGGKIIGAGGGGFILLMVEKHKQKKLISKLTPLITVPIKIDYEGSKIIFNEKKIYE